MKLPIKMHAQFQTDGKLIPMVIEWGDGRKIPIDKVKRITPGYELKDGMTGTRYTCIIAGREKYVYFSDNIWYVDVSDDYRGCGVDGC